MLHRNGGTCLAAGSEFSMELRDWIGRGIGISLLWKLGFAKVPRYWSSPVVAILAGVRLRS